MMETFGELQPGESILPLIDAFTAEIMPELPDKAKLIDMAGAYERKAHAGVFITLQEVAFLKLICDTYYQRRILKHAAKEIAVHV